jgi:hypothetical protein
MLLTGITSQKNQPPLLLLLAGAALYMCNALAAHNTLGTLRAAVLLLHGSGFCSRASTSCTSLGLQGVNGLLVPV